MPRYFFHLSFGDRIWPDEEGFEFPSRSVARAGDQINDMIMKGYHDRQAVMDRVNQRWDRTIRQVEVYHNPVTGENVELPSGYSHVWRDKSGEYVAVPTWIANPNYQSNGCCVELEKINP